MFGKIFIVVYVPLDDHCVCVGGGATLLPHYRTWSDRKLKLFMSIFFPCYHPCSTMQVLEHRCWKCGSSLFDMLKNFKMWSVLLGDEPNFKMGRCQKGKIKYKCLRYNSVFLSNNRLLCIINGYFYLKKKQCFIIIAFKCFSLP